MGEDIEEKISVEIKKNNRKIAERIFLSVQMTILFLVLFTEFKRLFNV